MKAILVVDMPKACEDCPLMLWDSLSEYYGACTPTLKEINCVAEEYKENENRSIRPSWCPLKPMPDRKEEGYPNDDYTIGKADGWNDCLYEILGETE